MRRLLPAATTISALLACAAIGAAPATAATADAVIYVDSASNAPAATCGASVADACETITDAVDRATGGEILDIAPGDYAGATINRPVTLRGAQAGVTGPARGIGTADPTSTIRGTLVIQAAVTIDGFEFAGIAAGPAIRLAAPVPGLGTGGPVIVNNTFTGIGGSQVVFADAAIDGLQVHDNLFAATPGGAYVALFVHGELISGGIAGVSIERNEFRGFTGHADSAVVDAGGVPGLRVRGNAIVDSGPLLVLSDTDGSTDRVLVQDNVGTTFTGPAIHLGGGIDGLTIERNRLSGGTGSALRLADGRGTGTSRDIVVQGNDISGFGSALTALRDSLDGTFVLRGNRLVLDPTGTAITNDTVSGTVDARRNWWGQSTGLPASRFSGAVDGSEPLRLVGVDAPAAVFVGGSGVATVRLVGAIGSGPETAAAGFPVTFSSTNAAIDAPRVTIAFGAASTLFTAGTTAGTTTTIATLDGESVAATTRIVAEGGALPAGPAAPSVADSAAPKPAAFLATVKFLTGRYHRALTSGLTQLITTNRAASVRTTYLVSAFTAKRLGLRPASSTSREWFVIGKVRTRAIRGTRTVTVDIGRRPRYAIARADHRVEVIVVTHIRTVGGVQRSLSRRVVLPARIG